MKSSEIAALRPEERLQLIEQLWDSLAVAPEEIPLTADQRQELDARLDAMEREGPTGIPWTEVLQRIRDHS